MVRRGAHQAGQLPALRNIPVGSTIHCIEMMPGKGAQIARSAGASAQLLAREGSYVQLRLRSGEIRKAQYDCRATLGEVGQRRAQPAFNRQGRRRGAASVRLSPRGTAMNPIDHPHGGGEGRTGEGRVPVTPGAAHQGLSHS